MKLVLFANVSVDPTKSEDLWDRLTSIAGCRKGSRECVYPEPSSSSKSRRGSTKSRSADGDGEGEGEGSSQEEGEGEGDDTLLEEDESPTATFAEPLSATSTKAGSPDLRARSDPPSLSHGSTPTPPIEGFESFGRSKSAALPPRAGGLAAKALSSKHKKWAELPGDIRFYLQYSRTYLTHHHWGLKLDRSNFVSRTLIEVALCFEPLLYAVVGYAAYHHTLTKPDGQLQDFLGYYQKSVSLLRQSFKKKPSFATILTVLQLATIEVCKRAIITDLALTMLHRSIWVTG
jgi:hypothetical protein